MNRLEMYKQRRRHRRLVFLTFFIGIMVIIVGLMTVDAAVNEMLGLEETKMMYVTQKADAIYELKFMDRYVTVNLIYVRQDYEQLMQWGKGRWHNVLIKARKLTEDVRTVMKQ